MLPGDVANADQAFIASVWRERAQEFGERCVINLNHPPELFDRITEQQKAILFPILRRLLTGDERRILDFGCGSGRFSAGLRQISKHADEASVVAYDICQELLDLAPPEHGVYYTSDYVRFEDGSYSSSFDLIWLCLVLGGIPDKLCRQIAADLSGSLKEDGLLFLVEHLAKRRASGEFWRFRPLEDYRRFFSPITLTRIGYYYDFGSRISIVVGTKTPERARELGLLRTLMLARSALLKPKIGT